MSKPQEDFTSHEIAQMHGEKTLNQSFGLTQENIAAILALIGKAEQEQKSPTALTMLSALKRNFGIVFDTMITNGNQWLICRVGKKVSDDVSFEYGKLPKTGNTTKALATASYLNFLQQDSVHSDLEIVLAEEESTHFEFVVKRRVF